MHSNIIQHPAEWAVAELSQLGYVLTDDVEPLGASVQPSGVVVFCFRMSGTTPSGERWEKKVFRRADDLRSLLHQVDDVTRKHPEFDLEQLALTDAASYHQLMAERRRARRESLNDGPSFLDGRMRCTLCKWHSQRMAKSGLHPIYDHYCHHVEAHDLGNGWIGRDDVTPSWCPRKGDS